MVPGVHSHVSSAKSRTKRSHLLNIYLDTLHAPFILNDVVIAGVSTRVRLRDSQLKIGQSC